MLRFEQIGPELDRYVPAALSAEFSTRKLFFGYTSDFYTAESNKKKNVGNFERGWP